MRINWLLRARRRAEASGRPSAAGKGKTGARGLRTILENILLDTMYDLPSLRNVQKVVVDETVIEGHTQPYIVYKAEPAAGAADPPVRKVSGSAG